MFLVQEGDNGVAIPIGFQIRVVIKGEKDIILVDLLVALMVLEVEVAKVISHANSI